MDRRFRILTEEVRQLLVLGCSYADRGLEAKAREAFEKALLADPECCEAHLDQAVLAYRAGDLETAWSRLHELLELEPDDADGVNLRGVLHAAEGARKHELADFQRALQLAPSNREALFNAAAAYLERGHLDTALDHVERLKTLCPGEGLVHYLDGLVKGAQGRRDAEVAAYRRALELGHERAAVYHNLGVALQESARAEEAETAFRRALELEPTALDTMLDLASALHERGADAEAVEVLRRAAEAHGDCADVWYDLGYVQASLGRDEEALEAYRAAIRLDTGYADAHYNLAYIHFRRREYDRAIAGYRRVVELQPDRYKAWYNLAFALDRCRRYDEAIEVWKRTLAFRPDDHKTYSKMGLAYLALGDQERARAACTRSLEMEPQGNVEAAYCRGVIAEATGDAAGALSALEQVVAVEPGFRDALTRVSALLRAAGRLEEALERAKQAVRQGASTAAYYQLGRAYLACERPDKARVAFEKGLARRPGHPRLLGALTALAASTGDQASAVTACRAAVDAEPSSHRRRLRLAMALAAAGDHAGALTEAKAAARLREDFAPAYMVAARAYLALGDRRKALKYRRRYKELRRGGGA